MTNDLIHRLRTSVAPEYPLGQLMLEAADALTAALSPTQGEPVAVKRLEWVPAAQIAKGERLVVALAHNWFGTFNVEKTDEGTFAAYFRDEYLSGPFFAEKGDAKAAAQAYYEARVLSCLAHPSKGEERLRRVRHKKRGSTYEVLGTAELQIAHAPVMEGSPLVIYRCEDDGKLWARELGEFEDGRFEDLPARAALAEGK